MHLYAPSLWGWGRLQPSFCFHQVEEGRFIQMVTADCNWIHWKLFSVVRIRGVLRYFTCLKLFVLYMAGAGGKFLF